MCIHNHMYIYIHGNIYKCTRPPTHLLTHTCKSEVLEDVCNCPFRTPSSTDCNRLQQTATDCTNLQKSAMHMQRRNPTLTHTNTHTNTHINTQLNHNPQPIAIDCNRLQQTATESNRLKKTATDCNRLQ